MIPVERIVERGLLASQIRQRYERAFRKATSENRLLTEAKANFPSISTRRINKISKMPLAIEDTREKTIKKLTTRWRNRLTRDEAELLIRLKTPVPDAICPLDLTPKGKTLLSTNDPSEEILGIARKAGHGNDVFHLTEFAKKLHTEALTHAVSTKGHYRTPQGHVVFSTETPKDAAGEAIRSQREAKVYNWNPKLTRRSKTTSPNDVHFKQMHSVEQHEVQHLASHMLRNNPSLEGYLVNELASIAAETIDSAKDEEYRTDYWLKKYSNQPNHALKPKFAELIKRVTQLKSNLKKYGKMNLATILADPEIKTLAHADEVITHLEQNRTILGNEKTIEKHVHPRKERERILNKFDSLDNVVNQALWTMNRIQNESDTRKQRNEFERNLPWHVKAAREINQSRDTEEDTRGHFEIGQFNGRFYEAAMTKGFLKKTRYMIPKVTIDSPEYHLNRRGKFTIEITPTGVTHIVDDLNKPTDFSTKWGTYYERKIDPNFKPEERLYGKELDAYHEVVKLAKEMLAKHAPKT